MGYIKHFIIIIIIIIFINHVTDIVTHVCYNSHNATNTLEEEWIDALLKPIPVHTLGLSANASTQMEQVMPCPSRGLTSQGRPSPQVSCHVLRLESIRIFAEFLGNLLWFYVSSLVEAQFRDISTFIQICEKSLSDIIIAGI